MVYKCTEQRTSVRAGWLPVNRESLAPEATVCGGLEYRPGVSDTAGRTLRRLQLPKGVFYTTYCVAEKS